MALKHSFSMDCYLRLKQVVHPIHLNVNIEIPIQNGQEEQ